MDNSNAEYAHELRLRAGRLSQTLTGSAKAAPPPASAPELRVSEAIESLAGPLDCLDKAVATLYERLASVLSEEEQTGIPGFGAGNCAKMCPLTNQIVAVESRVAAALWRLNRLVERVQL